MYKNRENLHQFIAIWKITLENKHLKPTLMSLKEYNDEEDDYKKMRK